MFILIILFPVILQFPSMWSLILTNNYFLTLTPLIFKNPATLGGFICWATCNNNFYKPPVALLNSLFLIHPTALVMPLFFFFKVFLKNLCSLSSLFPNKQLWLYCLTLLSAITLGGVWAQQEFNWGGWWSWDSVEISSLWVFLVFLGIVHNLQTAQISNTTPQFKLFIFSLIVGWFLNRSTLFSSIHSFAGVYIYTYLYLFLLFFSLFGVLYLIKYFTAPPQITFVFFFYIVILLYLVWVFCFFINFNITKFRFTQTPLLLSSPWILYTFIRNFTKKFWVKYRLLHVVVLVFFSFLLLAFNFFYKVIILAYFPTMVANQYSFTLHCATVLCLLQKFSIFLQDYFFVFFKPLFYFLPTNYLVWYFKWQHSLIPRTIVWGWL